MKTGINTVGKEHVGKISIWESHMGNILRGRIKLLAENVKHSNEVENLFCA